MMNGNENCQKTPAPRRVEATGHSSCIGHRSRWAGRDWLILLAYLALAHLIFYPALRPGVFLYGRDTTAHDYGLLLYNWSQILDHGQLALWNPHLFCGIPSLGTFAFCPFYPLTWLFAAMPFALAFTYQYVLNDWLAGLWTYWAARWMGLQRLGAFFAGMVFMVSGHVVTLAHAGHLQKLAAIAWIPFVLGCATAAVKQRHSTASFGPQVSGHKSQVSGFKYWVACGVGLAAQLLAAHVQIAYYTILFLVLWTLWLTVTQPSRLGLAPFGAYRPPRSSPRSKRRRSATALRQSLWRMSSRLPILLSNSSSTCFPAFWATALAVRPTTGENGEPNGS